MYMYLQWHVHVDVCECVFCSIKRAKKTDNGMQTGKQGANINRQTNTTQCNIITCLCYSLSPSPPSLSQGNGPNRTMSIALNCSFFLWCLVTSNWLKNWSPLVAILQNVKGLKVRITQSSYNGNWRPLMPSWRNWGASSGKSTTPSNHSITSSVVQL